jgi:hypothetical protein
MSAPMARPSLYRKTSLRAPFGMDRFSFAVK